MLTPQSISAGNKIPAEKRDFDIFKAEDFVNADGEFALCIHIAGIRASPKKVRGTIRVSEGSISKARGYYFGMELKRRSDNTYAFQYKALRDYDRSMVFWLCAGLTCYREHLCLSG